MQNPVTLEEMAQLLANWRAQKKSNNEKMPAALRTKLKLLLEKHSKHTIVNTLGVSKSTIHSLNLKRKSQAISSAKTNSLENLSSDMISFIPVNLGKQPFSQQDKPIKTSTKPQPICKISHPNGAELAINSGDISTIIQAFLCCK